MNHHHHFSIGGSAPLSRLVEPYHQIWKASLRSRLVELPVIPVTRDADGAYHFSPEGALHDYLTPFSPDSLPVAPVLNRMG